MQNLPQFVLKRLKESPVPADSHPDADLLTAFAEQSLAGRERALLIDHLGACGDCRDVVALALPANEALVQPDAAVATGIGWFRWPVLRWAAVAAGVAVASIGIVQYAHRSQPQTVASYRMEKSVAAPTAMKETTLPNATLPQSESKKPIVAKKKPATSVSPNPASRGGLGGHPGEHLGGVIAKESEPQPPLPEMSRQTKIRGSNEMVEVTGAAPPINTELAASSNQVAQNQSNLPLQGRNVTAFDVVKAKDPVPGQKAANAAPALAPPAPLQTAPEFMFRAAMRWSVTGAGVLQRSLDGGSTWESLNPALNAASSQGTPSKERADKSANQTSIDGQSTAHEYRKATAAANPAPVFRAVAALGPEVWAGGSGGALYHTSDGGSRWFYVAPSAAGAVLTGDVIGVQFSNPQQLTVSTSTNEVWITSDAGQSWRKQP